MSEVKLADLIDTRTTLPAVPVKYPASATFTVLVRPIASQLAEIVEEASYWEWDLEQMKKVKKLDQTRYLQLLGARAIANWSGLGAADLKRLVVIKNPKQLWKLGKAEIPFDGAARDLLLMHSPAFRAWIERLIVDIEHYNAERGAEAEKK